MDLIKRLFINETSSWFIQLFRYLFVGGFSFIVDYGLLYFLTEYLHLYYLLSATISFIAGLITNYLISTSWIFTKSKLKNRTAEFAIYGIIGVVGLFFNNIILYFLTDYIHIHYMISKLITTAIVLVWNFAARKYILYNK
jgi:putative flippase GtrA